MPRTIRERARLQATRRPFSRICAPSRRRQNSCVTVVSVATKRGRVIGRSNECSRYMSSRPVLAALRAAYTELAALPVDALTPTPSCSPCSTDWNPSTVDCPPNRTGSSPGWPPRRPDAVGGREPARGADPAVDDLEGRGHPPPTMPNAANAACGTGRTAPTGWSRSRATWIRRPGPPSKPSSPSGPAPGCATPPTRPRASAVLPAKPSSTPMRGRWGNASTTH
jgi:hypothetical protein